MGLGDAVTGVTPASDGFRNKAGRVNIEGEDFCLGPLEVVQGDSKELPQGGMLIRHIDESCINKQNLKQSYGYAGVPVLGRLLA